MAHNKTYKYQAFISYAHADEALAARLHRALETYPIPKHLTLKDGATRPKRLSPIFRDTAELTAHHSLSEKIREAVQSSRVLIILCSPAAKISHWVNEEIRLFRSLHGEGSILCVLAEGTPETSFPPALTEDGREPLAANLGRNKESFNLGVTQLAASMLGAGLDQLIQRDAKRRRNRFKVLTSASMVFAAVMGGMAWTAIDARNAAEVSRSEAENMVEYLITDLKKELDAVGRLSILDDVGTRVTDYYNAIPLSDMDDERLSRRARAQHILGEVAIKQGRLDHALAELKASYAATEEYLRRNPDNPEAIFAHAQSEYWIGKVYLQRGEPKKALPSRFAYSELSKRLYEIDSDNRDYVFEYGWAENNLGFLFIRLQNHDEAMGHYNAAVEIFENYAIKNTFDPETVFEIASIRRNLASAKIKAGMIKAGKENLFKVVQSLSDLHTQYPENQQYLYALTSAKLWLQVNAITHNECNVTEIKDAAEGIISLMHRDSTNELWNKDYLEFIRIVSEFCHSHLEASWLDQEVRYVLTAFTQIEDESSETLEKISWLETFQARKLTNIRK